MHQACPVCGDGVLTPHRERVEAEHRGQRGFIAHSFSVCSHCGSEQAGADELRANKRAMIAFKKHVDGLLTGSQVRTIREHLDITQADAAKIFGGGPVAFSKYEADDVMQSEAMDKLLRVSAAVPEAFEFLIAHAGIAEASFSGEWVSFDEAEMIDIKYPAANKPVLRVVQSTLLEDERQYA